MPINFGGCGSKTLAVHKLYRQTEIHKYICEFVCHGSLMSLTLMANQHISCIHIYFIMTSDYCLLAEDVI